MVSQARRERRKLWALLVLMLCFSCAYLLWWCFIIAKLLRSFSLFLLLDTLRELAYLLLLLRCLGSRLLSAVHAMAMALWLALHRAVRWLGDKAAAAQQRHHARQRQSAQAPGAPAGSLAVGAQLVQIIPALLSNLPPAGRLSLYQASKQLAQEVWRCSPALKLSLSDPNPVRRWTMQLQLPGAASPLVQLIKSCRPGASFLPEAAVLQRIQSLSLSSMQLDASSFGSLQTLLPNLKHLALVTCRVKPGPSAAAASSGATNLPLLRLHSFSVSESSAVGLVDQQHLHSLSTDDPGIWPLLEAGQFPALCVLRLVGGTVNDDQLDVLLAAKPLMQEVCLPQLRLHRDHSAQACSWGLLRLQGDPHDRLSGVYALELALLPLEGIRRVVVERELYAWSGGNVVDLRAHGCTWSTAYHRLREAAERLEFEPGSMGWGYLWAWPEDDVMQVDLGLGDDEPGFTLHLQHPTRSFYSAPPEARELAAVLARRLLGGTFVYSGCDLTDPTAALASLRSLPRVVHSLVLRHCKGVPRDPQELFAFMPLHVERLVVKAEPVLAVHPRLTRKEYRRQQPTLGVGQAALAAAQQ